MENKQTQTMTTPGFDKFNLVTDPWIPVRWKDGTANLVGLKQIFTDAEKIGDLATTPHERISILRLLICITQAAHGAPETSDDWVGWDIGLENSVEKYLAKWAEHFQLAGEGHRFLQSPIKDDKDYPIGQMCFHLPTGNTPTLFDHAEDNTNRNLSPATIALILLTYQNHFVGGSLASKVKGNGPAIKALHSFLIGKNLRETLIFNCIDAETLYPSILGKPVWEDGEKTDYLSRLVPNPCKLWLVKEGNRVCIDQGQNYTEYEASGIRESTTTVITGKRGGVETNVLLRASPNKGIWRDLHCITVIQKNEFKAPLTFKSHLQTHGEEIISFWAGELIKAKDAKILDAVESQFEVPFQLFTQGGQIRYQAGVKFSEDMSNRVYYAVKTYYETLKQDSPPTEAAKRHFWNTLDQKSATLLQLLQGIGTETDPMGTFKFGESQDPWTQEVRAAATAAYEHTCARGNPRQYKAYAAGLRALRPLPKKEKSTSKKTKSSEP